MTFAQKVTDYFFTDLSSRWLVDLIMESVNLESLYKLHINLLCNPFSSQVQIVAIAALDRHGHFLCVCHAHLELHRLYLHLGPEEVTETV